MTLIPFLLHTIKALLLWWTYNNLDSNDIFIGITVPSMFEASTLPFYQECLARVVSLEQKVQILDYFGPRINCLYMTACMLLFEPSL